MPEIKLDTNALMGSDNVKTNVNSLLDNIKNINSALGNNDGLASKLSDTNSKLSNLGKALGSSSTAGTILGLTTSLIEAGGKLVTTAINAISSLGELGNNAFDIAKGIYDAKSTIETYTLSISKDISRLSTDDENSYLARLETMAGLTTKYGIKTLAENFTEEIKTYGYTTQATIEEAFKEADIKSVADRITGTFEWYSQELRNLYRLQGEDSNEYRAGMDLMLNEYLNEIGESTAYLTEGIATLVQNSMHTTESLLTVQEGVELESTLQTWTAAMYEAGMDQKVITGIADELNNWGSGNISGLSNNGISTLLTMAAANSNVDISNLLLNGLDSNSIDSIMSAVVSILSGAGESGNNVLMNALADTYGVSVTDLVAAGKVSQNAGATWTASDMSDSYQSAYNSVTDRTTLTQGISNFLENAQYQIGEAIVTNANSLMTYEIGQALVDTGDSTLKTVGNAMKFSQLENGLETLSESLENNNDELTDLEKLVNSTGVISDGIEDIASALSSVLDVISTLSGYVNNFIEYLTGMLMRASALMNNEYSSDNWFQFILGDFSAGTDLKPNNDVNEETLLGIDINDDNEIGFGSSWLTTKEKSKAENTSDWLAATDNDSSKLSQDEINYFNSSIAIGNVVKSGTGTDWRSKAKLRKRFSGLSNTQWNQLWDSYVDWYNNVWNASGE